MASPQKENGYTAIANELLEALARIRISGEVRQIIDTIIRKTYGYQKRDDSISLSQFCLSTGLRKSGVCRAINKGIFINVIIKKDNGYITKYSINKDFDTWKPLSKKRRGVSKKIISVIKIDNNRYQKRDIQKKVTKETITKEIAEQSSAPFSLKEEITKLENNARRDMNIIALYFEERKPDLQNKEQFQVALKRHLRPAKQLIPFTDNQILKGLREAKRVTPDYTIETITKMLIK